LNFKNTVREGDFTLIFLSRRKCWLVQALSGRKLHTHRGYIDLGSIIGLEYGSTVSTSLGDVMWVLKPTMRDYVLKGLRKTQVVYPKDLGIIAAWTGLSPGHIVVESGTGSGIMTIFTANLVKPYGHVYSYEIRREFLEVAVKNIERAGLSEYVTLKHADAKEGIDVKDADVALIDVGDPWSLVEPMKNALKNGGVLAAVSPTMNQVEKLTARLSESGFIDIESLEVLVRSLEAREGMTRPSMRMIGHTAYLTFARKAKPTDKD